MLITHIKSYIAIVQFQGVTGTLVKLVVPAMINLNVMRCYEKGLSKSCAVVLKSEDVSEGYSKKKKKWHRKFISRLNGPKPTKKISYMDKGGMVSNRNRECTLQCCLHWFLCCLADFIS